MYWIPTHTYLFPAHEKKKKFEFFVKFIQQKTLNVAKKEFKNAIAEK